MQVYGDKDPDGFFWGECRGRLGFVPHNMVEEIKDPRQIQQLNAGQASGPVGPGPVNRRGPGPSDRYGDIYSNMPVKKMIALYDYDPQVLSPNVDAEVRFYEILNLTVALSERRLGGNGYLSNGRTRVTGLLIMD